MSYEAITPKCEYFLENIYRAAELNTFMTSIYPLINAFYK